MNESLAPGERVVRCLLGQSVDHIPFGIGVGWAPWFQTVARWKEESGIASLDVPSYFGYEPSFALPSHHAGIYPGFEKKVIEETEETITYRDERGITQCQRRDYASMPLFLDYPVRTRDDWERLKAERLDPAAPGRINQDWPAFRDRLASSGEAVQVGNFPYGVFGTPRDLMGVEPLLTGLYEQPDLIRDMMNHLTTLWISLWERIAEHVQIDHIHIWEDMSGKNGSLISPALVEEFMMPCYDRIAEFGRRAG
ncbi:hypothetical protein HQ520_07780, partial [bacterium]|nr:hypothetical protein [bacterium]